MTDRRERTVYIINSIINFGAVSLTVRLSLSSCMMRVLSLYVSSFKRSRSAMASSNAYKCVCAIHHYFEHHFSRADGWLE